MHFPEHYSSYFATTSTQSRDAPLVSLAYKEHGDLLKNATVSCHWVPGERAQHPPLHVLSSGSGGEQRGHPSASSSPN